MSRSIFFHFILFHYTKERSLNKQDDVWDNSEVWEAKLRTESREAVETITNLRVRKIGSYNALFC